MSAAPPPSPLVSVVMPCLNEAETVERCVAEALRALAGAGLDGEVVVADNGSTDGSRELAARAGARVVPVAERGYGAALLGGIEAEAMPPLHRSLGNPVLSFLGRLFFRLRVSGFHCGLRAIRRVTLETGLLASAALLLVLGTLRVPASFFPSILGLSGW